jgi:DTW domain-containing protein YfiP
MQSIEPFDEAKIIASCKSGPFEIIRHHKAVPEILEKLLQKWDRLLLGGADVSDHGRCSRCWTKKQLCYCSHFDEQSLKYAPTSRNDSSDSNDNPMSIKNCEVIMYYAPQEIGRTPNTAHVIENILPYCHNRILMGDEMSEQRLIAEMVDEYRSGNVRTCILYPNKESMLLSEWSQVNGLNTDTTTTTTGNETGTGTGTGKDVKKKIRMIALDGTYSVANRLYKHLDRCLKLAHVPTPLVKLDLPPGGIKSSIMGIMRQPGVEKICTYQALVLAFQQCNENREMCKSLLYDLDTWLEYILKKNIKMAKSEEHVKKHNMQLGWNGLSDDDKAPAEYVTKYMNISKQKIFKNIEGKMKRKELAEAEASAGVEAGVGVEVGICKDEGINDGNDISDLTDNDEDEKLKAEIKKNKKQILILKRNSISESESIQVHEEEKTVDVEQIDSEMKVKEKDKDKESTDTLTDDSAKILTSTSTSTSNEADTSASIDVDVNVHVFSKMKISE